MHACVTGACKNIKADSFLANYELNVSAKRIRQMCSMSTLRNIKCLEQKQMGVSLYVHRI